jgi:REP element-mobilizing transposase RayT
MNAFHITWVTHNSRVSERMKKYKVEKGPSVILGESEEAEILSYISDVIKEDNLKILAFNICRDHVHMLLVCKDEERDGIVQKLKSVSSRKFNLARKHNKLTNTVEQGVMTPCSKTNRSLWAQKYNRTAVLTDEQLAATYEYITHNRLKHRLNENKKLKATIEEMLTPYDKIF